MKRFTRREEGVTLHLSIIRRQGNRIRLYRSQQQNPKIRKKNEPLARLNSAARTSLTAENKDGEIRLLFGVSLCSGVPSLWQRLPSRHSYKSYSVLDSDTLQALNGYHADRIRLSGIDCPEKGQAYGKRAKQAASGLAFGKEVTIQAHGHDKYKRTLGDVLLPDGMNVNQELVKQGWCWWYQKYAPGDAVLEGLEKEAREAKKGLWADPQPVPPWEWRKRKERA